MGMSCPFGAQRCGLLSLGTSPSPKGPAAATHETAGSSQSLGTPQGPAAATHEPAGFSQSLKDISGRREASGLPGSD